MAEFFRKFDVPDLAVNTSWMSPIIDMIGVPGVVKIVSRFTNGAPQCSAYLVESDDATEWWTMVTGNGLEAWNDFVYGPILAGMNTARYVRAVFQAGSTPTPACKCIIAGLRS